MKLYSKNELKDSRIFFEKNPPRFLTVFIGFTCILLILLIITSMYLVKPYIIKAQGTVTTTDNTYQSVQMNGYILKIHALEGEKVKKGDILFTLSNGQEGIQDQALLEQINYLNSKIVAMDKYEKSLNNKKNLMTNKGVELEYFGMVEYYISQIEGEKYTEINSQNNLNEKVTKRQNLETELYYLQSQLNDLEDIEDNGEQRSKLTGEIEAKQSEIETLSEEIKQLQMEANDPSSQSGQLYAQLISELGTDRTNTNSQILDLEAQLKVAEGQSNLLSIKAINDGYVHYLSNLKVGMSVQQNQVIAEISMNQEDQLNVEAYIEASDITKVEIGNDVNIALVGINIQKYGTLKGKLVSIDTGTISQETDSGNLIYYKCNISLTKTQLKATDGSTIKVLKSMPIEARIIYEKETYFEWILEILSFKN